MTRPKPPILPARRNCIDCGDLVMMDDVDEIAVCYECTLLRRAEEGRARQGSGQAGARWVGHEREHALRPTAAEWFASKSTNKEGT